MEEATTVVLLQTAVLAQLLPVPDITVLTRLPAALATAAIRTLADAPTASPAGMLQFTLLPEMLQLAPAGVTVTLLIFAGKVLLKVTTAVVAAEPLLTALIVQLIVSPTLAVALSTVPVNSTLATAAAVTLVLVVQTAGVAQLVLAPAGTTVVTRLPAAAAFALICTLALAFGARPAAMLQLSVLPLMAEQVAPVAVTVAPLILAGKLVLKVTAPTLGALPLLSALILQVNLSPTMALALSTLAVTLTFGRVAAVTVVVAAQLAAATQVGASGPLAITLLANLSTPAAVADNTTLALAFAARPAGMVQVSVLTAGPQVAPVAVTLMPLILAGTVMTRVTGPLVAPGPLLLALIVQVTRSPTDTALRSTDWLTCTDASTVAGAPVSLPPPPQADRNSKTGKAAARRNG